MYVIISIQKGHKGTESYGIYALIIDSTRTIREFEMLNKITDFIIGMAVFMSILAGAACLISHQASKMEQYAIEHNCKWDYNDMCYTREQKPWLFE